jgi:glycosyltransferase involved in cell wall biosynthesis
MKVPSTLNICVVANKFPLRRDSDELGFLWPVAKGLSQRGHSVTVLSTTNSLNQSEITLDGVKAYYLKTGRDSATPFSELLVNKFQKLHKENPFHILHCLDSSGFVLSREKKTLHIPIAFDVEATQMSQLFAIIGMGQENIRSLFRTAVALTYKFLVTFFGGDRQLLKSADGIFVMSPQQRLALERYYLYPDARIFTVPYSMEVSSVLREKPMALVEKWSIPSDSQVVVTISDMTELSELRNILLAFQKAVIKRPSARLIIVGNGPLFKEVEFEVLNLALGSKVILTGAVTNMEIPEYISLAKVFINISARTTGFEFSILEAMMQKKAVIGSEVSPIANIIEDGHDGFLIRPADISSMSSLLLQIFSNRLPVTEIGENAFHKVSNLFDLDKIVEQTILAYAKIIGTSKL